MLDEFELVKLDEVDELDVPDDMDDELLLDAEPLDADEFDELLPEEALLLDDVPPWFDEPPHAVNVASRYVTTMVLTDFISSHLCYGKVRRQCS